MKTITGRNVNHVYVQARELVDRDGIGTPSRNGKVRTLPYPLLTCYEWPMERVLFDPARRANPAFHLMEACWMLAGRSDAAFLNNYVRDFGDRFGNEDGHLDGAYGARWRRHFPPYGNYNSGDRLDQLNDVVEKLSRDPYDRRVVIQMWDPTVDNRPETRDACCNQQAIPRIVGGRLDLTITCRSNDAIWGATGANACHFSILQEYLAGRIGVGVGRLYQFATNYHIYDWALPQIGQPRPAGLDPYTLGKVTPRPMADRWDRFDEDLDLFMRWHDDTWAATNPSLAEPAFVNDWFRTVACRMARAYLLYRLKRHDLARLEASHIHAQDWRLGALQWLDSAAYKRQPSDVRPAAAGQDSSAA